MFDIHKVRKDFPILDIKVHNKDLIYFDNAATTLKPKSVVDSLANYYSFETANVHRGVHYLSEHGTTRFEHTRKTVQKFINAFSEVEVIFTKGTTESMNLLAATLVPSQLKKGDVILISTMEHHSNIVPWQIEAKKIGAIIKEIPISENGEIDEEAYYNLLNENVKIVTMTHVSNTLGTINPLKKFIKAAKDIGAYFVVDAAQSVAHTKVDVQDLGCDFLAFSSHKLFGPNGVGILWGKEQLLENLPPYQGGGAMISKVTITDSTYADLPNKFEAGTPHIAGVICFKDALDYVSKIGIENIENYEQELLNYATEKFKSIEGLKIIGQAKEKASVISFVFDNIHPQDIGTLLDQQGIAVRTGHHCTQPLMDYYHIPGTTRASFSFYNTKEEIDLLINAINKAKEFL